MAAAAAAASAAAQSAVCFDGGVFHLKKGGGKKNNVKIATVHHRCSQHPFTSQCVRRAAPPSHASRRRLHIKCEMSGGSSTMPTVVSEKRVTLVRHGQSTWNKEGRIQGSSDFSVLTDKGEGQADISRHMLQGKHFDVGFRSPLARASRTAEVIWDSRPSELIDVWELREIDLYSFQGLLKEEGKEKYGVVYDAWKADPANFEIDGKFPVRELWERGARCWDTILKAEGTDVLVVAHNAVNQSMVANALGLGPEFFRRLAQSNCGLTTFAFTPSGSGGAEPAQAVVLEQLNQTPTSPLKGNADKAQNRAVLICASAFKENEAEHGGEIVSAISRVLGDERVESLLCDDAASSFALARGVSAALRRETETPTQPSEEETMNALLQSAGTTVMFAESRTIESVVERALQIDKGGLGSRLRLSRGGITVVDFVGRSGDENASVACLNYTAHLP